MTVEMVPRDQLQACAAANRHLRDELARVEGERDALLVVRDAATELYERVEMDESVGVCLSSRGEALNLADALAPFRKDGQ